jgi:hypothetical protein
LQRIEETASLLSRRCWPLGGTAGTPTALQVMFNPEQKMDQSDLLRLKDRWGGSGTRARRLAH